MKQPDNNNWCGETRMKNSILRRLFAQFLVLFGLLVTASVAQAQEYDSASIYELHPDRATAEYFRDGTRGAEADIVLGEKRDLFPEGRIRAYHGELSRPFTFLFAVDLRDVIPEMDREPFAPRARVMDIWSHPVNRPKAWMYPDEERDVGYQRQFVEQMMKSVLQSATIEDEATSFGYRRIRDVPFMGKHLDVLFDQGKESVEVFALCQKDHPNGVCRVFSTCGTLGVYVSVRHMHESYIPNVVTHICDEIEKYRTD